MKCRCAIVPAGLATLAAHAASHLPKDEFVVVNAQDAPDVLCDAADCVLVMASASTVRRTLDAITAWRRAQPAAAVLAVSEPLETLELDALFECGADDFVALPFDPRELASRMHHAIGAIHHTGARDDGNAPRRPPGFIGSSPAFVAQLAKLPAFAACDAGVLIGGETGTGKEIFAQALHYLSARADRPLVAVNCGAIPGELIEDEMFGHVRGAYTTAHDSRTGLVGEAEGGTLFLDDIDSLPMSAQAKLLRFLQEREYRSVGSNTVRRANVRVVAASNLDLSELARQGRFRQDLYFRLNILALHLPPLRARSEDIRPLALHFIERANASFDRRIAGLGPRALRRLLAHAWPGNVRELQHVIERAVLLARGPLLDEEDIDVDGTPGDSVVIDSFQLAKARVVMQFERAFIERLLLVHAGNVTHAARAARKNRRAFFELMRKHRIEPERFRGIAS